MPKLRSLSGKDLLRIFAGFEFSQLSQRGSHIKLRRTLPSGVHQTLTIVYHVELDRGTLHAIYRQALRFMRTIRLNYRPSRFLIMRSGMSGTWSRLMDAICWATAASTGNSRNGYSGSNRRSMRF